MSQIILLRNAAPRPFASSSPALAVLGQLPFGDYMTAKDATILLVPGRITAHSEVTKVFVRGLPGRKLIVVVEIRFPLIGAASTSLRSYTIKAWAFDF